MDDVAAETALEPVITAAAVNNIGAIAARKINSAAHLRKIHGTGHNQPSLLEVRGRIDRIYPVNLELNSCFYFVMFCYYLS
ncbi:hypothetical protein [Oceanibaculum pacificum]|uniref:hypothetical protein n=1 Tax=Oceanibaculum pacificum TaxID=580166 RepID=UPI0018DCFB41|nr:hypothetical protein [Oceanibaculum pacificum]